MERWGAILNEGRNAGCNGWSADGDCAGCAGCACEDIGRALVETGDGIGASAVVGGCGSSGRRSLFALSARDGRPRFLGGSDAAVLCCGLGV
jgi:hypothetical protein